MIQRPMSTRAPSWSSAIAVIAACLLPATGAAAQGNNGAPTHDKQPDILLFIADDLAIADGGTAYWNDVHPGVAVNGSPTELDTLIGSGVRFTRAQATSATCTVARSSLFTGLYPFSNGATTNHGGDGVVSFGTANIATYFKSIGYEVFLAGKPGVSIFTSKEETSQKKGLQWTYVPGSSTNIQGYKGCDAGNELCQDLNIPATVTYVADHHDKSKPLLLIMASRRPHVRWPPAPDAGNDLTLPPRGEDTPGNDQDSQTRRMLSAYYADVAGLDQELKDVRTTVYPLLNSNRITVFTSDQGAQWPFAKWTLYEAGLRIPLIVNWTKDGQQMLDKGMSAKAVSGVDLFPTLARAGALSTDPLPTNIDGVSFLGELQSASRTTTPDAAPIFGFNTGDVKESCYPMRSVVAWPWKLIHNLHAELQFNDDITKNADGPFGDTPTPAGEPGSYYEHEWVGTATDDAFRNRRTTYELFNLQSDPDETDNKAAGNPGRVSSLSDKIDAWRAGQSRMEGGKTIKDTSDALPGTTGLCAVRKPG